MVHMGTCLYGECMFDGCTWYMCAKLHTPSVGVDAGVHRCKRALWDCHICAHLCACCMAGVGTGVGCAGACMCGKECVDVHRDWVVTAGIS